MKSNNLNQQKNHLYHKNHKTFKKINLTSNSNNQINKLIKVTKNQIKSSSFLKNFPPEFRMIYNRNMKMINLFKTIKNFNIKF